MGRRKKGSNTKMAEEKWAVGKMGSEIGFSKKTIVMSEEGEGNGDVQLVIFFEGSGLMGPLIPSS